MSNIIDMRSSTNRRGPSDSTIKPPVTGNKVETTTSKIEVTEIPNPQKSTSSRYRRMQRTSFQARLGRKMDSIVSKLMDNNLRLSSHPTDMLRIKVKRDERSHDLVSRTIESAEVMPILLPKMEDIPMRHLVRGDNEILIPSLFMTPENKDCFELYAPIECNLEMDDLLLRIITDNSPNIDDSYVICLQVKEILATFSYSSILYKKYIATFYDEKLPQEVINLLREDIRKREKLGW